MEATSGVLAGLFSTPQGGGGLRGLGERFQPDLFRGSGSYGIPISAPRGPNEQRPNLSLRYSTGSANGPLGMGWRIVGPFDIRRRADHGVPTYRDADDEFVLAGAETLVDIGGGRFRPRADTQFLDIRRQDEAWLIRTKDGRHQRLGSTPAAQIRDGARVFAWLTETETDPAGNTITFSYEQDGGQAYLSEVNWSIYSIRFVYGERPDVMHDARPGFPVLTARRCTAIERRCPKLAQPLLARFELVYSEAEASNLSLLTEVHLTGFGPDGETERFAPVRLTYRRHDPGAARYVPVPRGEAAPPRLDEAGTALVDMDGDGVPDILSTGDSGHRFWRNDGRLGFGAPRSLPGVPPGFVVGRSGVSFGDLDGNGTVDLFRVGTRLGQVVRNTGRGAWSPPETSAEQPALRLSATDSRLVDLDGDGVVDLLQSTPGGLLLTYRRPGGNWSRPELVAQLSDGSRLPQLSLDDRAVRLADMTGDGLADLAFVSSGRVEYWPAYGRGSWGPRVRMAGAPVLPPGFDQDRLFMPDIDGDGTADLLYVDFDRVYYWLNQSGLTWSRRQEVAFVPPPDVSTLEVVDFFGDGGQGVLWCTRDRHAGGSGYHYLDLAAGGKPYLLTRVENGMGGVTDIEYASTAALRAVDAAGGRPWESYLPFPVQVVVGLTNTDVLTGTVRRTRLRYHRGYYDALEREFRGFEEVELESEGDEHTSTVVQSTRFFLAVQAGPTDLDGVAAEERARDRALAGSPLEARLFEVGVDGSRTLVQTASTTWEARLEYAEGGRFVHFPRATRIETRDHGAGSADRVEVADYDHDQYGNLVSKRRSGRFDGEPDGSALVSVQTIRYATDENAWLVGLPASIETRDSGGKLLSHTRHLYDGDPYTGLPEGQVTSGLLTKTRELALDAASLPDGYVSEIRADWGLVQERAAYYRTTVAYERDVLGNVVGQRNGLGEQQSIAYDADSLFPVRGTDASGLVTEADFDPRTAQPLEMRMPNGTVTRYEYSPIGRLRAQRETTGGGSVELTQAFDVDYGDYTASPPRPARVVSVKPLAPGAASERFRSLGDLDALDGVDVQCDFYDGDGNLLQRLRRAPEGSAGGPWVVGKRRKYTIAGRPAIDYPNAYAASASYQVGLPGDLAVRFFYSGSGDQPYRIEQPDGGRLLLSFEPGQVARRLPNMADGDPPMVETQDAWGRISGVRVPDGAGGAVVTSYTTDLLGRPLQVMDASGRVQTSYTFAGPGPAVRIAHAEAGSRTYWRDAEGRLRLRTDSLGRRLVMEYDASGRLTSAIDAGDRGHPTVVRALTYSGPQLVEAREGTVSQGFTYDAAGRLAATSTDTGDGRPLIVAREYGLAGELRAVVYPDGTRVEQRYDSSLALRGVEGFVDGIDYDAYESPTRISFAGGAEALYDHEPAMRRLRRVALMGVGGQVRAVTLSHDLRGSLTSVLDELPDATFGRGYSYDGAGRLVRAELRQGALDGTLLRDDNYSYSPNGDLLRNDESPTGAMSYEDPLRPGLLTGVERGPGGAAVKLEYDGAGRTTALGTAGGLTYDLWDRIVAATLRDGSSVELAYDAQGRRVRKIHRTAQGDNVTRYAENLYEEGPDGRRLSVYAGRLLVGLRHLPAKGDPVTAAVLTDHLGSVLAACDTAGRSIHQQVYSPFGLSLRVVSVEDRYAGVRPDTELGLVQFGARYYAPWLGRFVTPDWFVIENPSRALPIPQSLNVYSYALNNPLTHRDPSGLWFGIDDLVVAAVGFFMGFFAGLFWGLSHGQGWGSLLNALEGGLVGAAGGWLAYNTVGLALGILGIPTSSGIGFGFSVAAAVVGTFNGVVSGALQIYDWKSWKGWLSFIADSTWGLVGTALGDLVHTINFFYSDSQYRWDLSRRQNRHVYDGGFGFGEFAFTQGNVISNLHSKPGDNLVDHETLHTWQNRMFGPIYQTVYVGWMVLGFVFTLFVFGFTIPQSFSQTLEDIAYNDNPWEIWAYREGGERSCGLLCYG